MNGKFQIFIKPSANWTVNSIDIADAYSCHLAVAHNRFKYIQAFSCS